MVERTNEKSAAASSNMLVIASSEHFPLFDKPSENWSRLISCIRTELGVAGADRDDTVHNTLGEHLVHLISQVSKDIHVTKLASFKRILLHFKDMEFLHMIMAHLKQFGIKCWKGWRHVGFKNEPLRMSPEKPSFKPESLPKSEAAVDGEDFESLLKPPNRPVQLQSPPPSPYLGWVQREEDPPDLKTIADPKSMKEVLYEETGKRVFHEDEEEDFSLDSFSLDPAKTLPKVKVPNIIVDTVEAESLRQIAKDLESNII